jgi:hypothetical protein
MQGRKLWFCYAPDLLETRMYRSLRHLVEGWSKNVYLGGRRSFPEEPLLQALVPIFLVLPSLFWMLPPAWLASSIAAGHGFAPAALLATALSAGFWMLISHGMRIPWPYGLAYPLGALVMLGIVVRSMLRGRRAVEWKGRQYRLHEGRT